jgi:hypothetical protein
MTRTRPYRPRHTGPGTTAGNMRQQGVRNLDLRCGVCHHEALLNADHMADDVEIHSIDERLVCSRCGSVGQTDVRPNWLERAERPSLTGDQYND